MLYTLNVDCSSEKRFQAQAFYWRLRNRHLLAERAKLRRISTASGVQFIWNNLFSSSLRLGFTTSVFILRSIGGPGSHPSLECIEDLS